MTTERIVPGTATMLRYPEMLTRDPRMIRYVGIPHYGTHSVNGISCLKVSLAQGHRLENAGWQIIKVGTGYAYITQEKTA